MYEDRFVNAVREFAEQFRRRMPALAIRRCCNAGEQVIDDGGERGGFRVFSLELDAALEPSADRDALHLLRQFLDRVQLASLYPIEHQ